MLHRPTGDSLQPSAEDERRGYVVFQRDYMQDVYYNDTPKQVVDLSMSTATDIDELRLFAVVHD